MHDRSEDEVFGLLIDTYRLRVKDGYVFTGDVAVDSLYGSEGDPSAGLLGFRKFMRTMTTKQGGKKLLPPWWTPNTLQNCAKFARSRLNGNQWHDLGCAVEKSDIVEHYHDPMMPMQLRMLAEEIYGSGAGGASGIMMRALMGGGGHMSNLSMT